MKKTIIILSILTIILCLNKYEQEITIPKDSIRFRIIANSNKEEDQRIKQEIIKSLQQELQYPKNINTIEDTRSYIKKELPKFEQIVEKTLKEQQNNNSFHINYGKNYFPEKTYKGVIYEEGEYESLVITLGEASGENFWCVLFPPLCFIEENPKIEYKSFIKEILNKYF